MMVSNACVMRVYRPLGPRPGTPPGRALQVTPVRHHGQHLGDFYFSDKEGGELRPSPTRAPAAPTSRP